MLCRDPVATVWAGSRSHRTVNTLVLVQSKLLEVAAALLTLDLTISAALKMALQEGSVLTSVHIP